MDFFKQGMKGPTRPAPPAPGLAVNRYSPVTNWNDDPFGADVFEPNPQYMQKKKPPPRPPPPKVNKLPDVPAKPSHFIRKPTVLSSLLGAKKKNVIPSQTNPNYSTTNFAIEPEKMFPKCDTKNVSTGALIDLSSPPSSPTFTTRSSSDGLSVDSFGSDATTSTNHHSAFNGGSVSQAESGFEDDFDLFLNTRKISREDTLDDFGATDPFSPPAVVKPPILKKPVLNKDLFDVTSNGKPSFALKGPTIIRAKPARPKPPDNSALLKSTFGNGLLTTTMNLNTTTPIQKVNGFADFENMSDEFNDEGGITPDAIISTRETMRSASSRSSLEDDEMRTIDQEILAAISPLTIPDETAPRFVIQEVRGGPAGRSGRSTRGGRASGRGRGGLRSGRVNEWERGQHLVQKFVSDDELPPAMRRDIAELLSARNRRERNVRSRRQPNVEEMDDNENEENEDDFYDAEEFLWQPMDEWASAKEPFVPASTGPTERVTNSYDAFKKYWDEDILSHIVTETNRYAQSIAATSARFGERWVNTTADEIMILFAFWMMLGVIKMPTIKSCYSNIPIMKTDVFRNLLPQVRYWDLNRAFHLANGSRDANDRTNILFPMGPIIDHLNQKFQQNYILQQDICIDESLTLWKGPVGFKQFIRTKSARFGMKSYQLCESATGYLWKFFIYIGKSTTSGTSAMPVSFQYVKNLVQPLLNLGHTLFLDNWFNSPTLARFLKKNKTDCVGTLRSNRRDVPPVLKKVPLKEGEFVARQSGDVMVVSLHDRRRVSLISTFHGVDQVLIPAKPGRPAHYRLKLVHEYNQGMGGVDKMDQMLESYLLERKKCSKWTKKLFKRLLNVSIQNARILVERSLDTKLDSLAFRVDLIENIVQHHLHLVQKPATRTIANFPPERLTGRHFIQRTPITDAMKAAVKCPSNRGKRVCVWCSANKKKTRTVFECPECDVPLCIDYCFKFYHTKSEIPNRRSQ